MHLDKKKMKIFLFLSILFLVTATLGMGRNTIVAASPATTISLNPRTISGVMPGETFSVDIIATDVTAEDGLWGYQFILSYDTDVLTATAYSSYDPFVQPWPSEINDTAGHVSVAYSMNFGTDEGKKDDFSLAKIDFTVDAHGASVLDLRDTDLATPSGAPVDHKVLDGSFANVGEKIAVSPNFATAKYNETFYINITIAETSKEVWSYYFNLTYDTEVLTAKNATSLDPFSIEEFSEINNASGYVAMNYSVPEGGQGFSTFEPEPIARIGFRVDNNGTCPLEFMDTELIDVNGTLIPHEVIHGSFSNNLDIAVTDISASPMKLLTGGIVTINVTIQNHGDFPVTFNVTLQYATTTIETKTNISLDPEESKTLIFTWDTTGTSEEVYTLKATAISPIDVDLSNNVSAGLNIIIGESQMRGLTLLYGVAIGTGVVVGATAIVYSRKAKRRTRIAW